MRRTVSERLAFLVAFAGEDLAALDNQGQQGIRASIRSFLEGSATTLHATCRNASPETANWDDIAAAQRKIQTVLNQTVGRRLKWAQERQQRPQANPQPGQPVARIESVTTFWNANVHIGVTPTRLRDKQSAALEVRADLPDVLVFVAQLVVWTEEPATPIRRCAADGCQRFFVAVRSDSRCCSTACTKRDWWARPKGRKKLKQIYKDNGWKLGARTPKHGLQRKG
jgi:hypothetical protein